MQQLVSVSNGNTPVQLSTNPEVIRRIENSRELVCTLASQGYPLYGVTTRFGGMATNRLNSTDVVELQNKIVWLHKTGLGRQLERRDVRAGMLLRMNSLARGVSGIRRELIERLGIFLNQGVTPVVHEFGSIGASGDLVPLSYVAGALIGSDAGFKVQWNGRELDAREVLNQLNLDPITLQAKEGLALINGTSMSTGIAANCLGEARKLIALTLAIHGLMMEALAASSEPFDAFIHQHKAHPGQVWTAERMRSISSGSRLMRMADAEDGTLIQDRYSMRCLPQYFAPVIEGLWHSIGQIEVEMNSVSDNPLIDGESGKTYSGGNFLGQIPALAMDHLRQYLGLLAKHMDAQIALLMEPSFNNGLSGSLAGNVSTGTNMGMKGLQLSGNSMMPLLTFYGNTYIDRFPTHAEQFNQNINSQSYLAGQLANESIRIYRHYLAIALLIAVQGADLRAHQVTGSFDASPVLSEANRHLYKAVHQVIERDPDSKRPLVWNDNEQSLDIWAAVLHHDIAEGHTLMEALNPELIP